MLGGGSTLHALNLTFRSPFVNFFMQAPEFARMAAHLPEYLRQPVELDCFWWDEKNQKRYPRMRLGDVLLYANHYKTAAGFQEKWQARRARFCWDNVFVETVAADEHERQLAEAIPYRKVCFTAFPTDAPFAVCLQRKPENESIGFYSQKMAAMQCAEQCYDPLRLLLGREDFMRRA